VLRVKAGKTKPINNTARQSLAIMHIRFICWAYALPVGIGWATKVY